MSVSSISLVTALEIFGNPNDLEIVLLKEENRTYSAMICRGPGHNGKLLLTAESLVENRDGAVDMVKKALEAIYKTVVEKLGGDFGQPDVLTPDLIVRVCEELRHHQIAKTYEMIATIGPQTAVNTAVLSSEGDTAAQEHQQGVSMCRCGAALPRLLGRPVDWGDWRCLHCGQAYCQDCGAHINMATMQCEAYEAEKNADQAPTKA